MFRAGDWIGKVVVSGNNGKELGDVEDLIFENDRLSYLVVPPELPWEKNRCIPVTGIEAAGDEIIVVDDEGAAREENHQDVTLRLGKKHLLGKRAMTIDGYGLGEVSDVYISSEVGKIVGYEISQGFMKDFVEGRMYLPVAELERIGEDWLIFKSNRKERDLRVQ